MHRRCLMLVPIILLVCVLSLGILFPRSTQAHRILSGDAAAVNGHWVQVASPVSESLRAIDMLSATSGWAGGTGPSLLRYSDGSWTKVESPVITNGISAIDALSENDVWATDYGGRILHYDGSGWKVIASPTTDALQAIKMISPTQGWAVGLNRTALRWNGTQWLVMPEPTDSRPGFYGVLPFSANDVWATVLRGVHHWDGATWTFYELTHDSTYYGDVLGLSSSDLWVMGTTMSYAWHFDGVSWTNRWSPISAQGAAMVSGTDIWVVGSDGNSVGGIAHWDGVEWEQVPSPAMAKWQYLYSISMVSAEDGWAVGDGGVILHYVPGPAPTDTPTATAISPSTSTPTATATPSAVPALTSTPTPTTPSSGSGHVYLPLILNVGVPSVPTPTPTPTATPTVSGDGCTFTDTFTDPTSGWPTLDVPNGNHYSNSAYDVLVRGEAQTVLLINPNTRCDNSRIQVDLNWVTPVWVGRAASEWGVVFRYTDDANYYSFNIVWDGSAGYYIVRKMVNGVSTNLTAYVSDRNYYFHPLSANHAYVSTRGNQIVVGAVSQGVDTPLATITDTSLPSGYAGLRHRIDGGGIPFSLLNTRTSLFTQRPQP